MKKLKHLTHRFIKAIKHWYRRHPQLYLGIFVGVLAIVGIVLLEISLGFISKLLFDPSWSMARYILILAVAITVMVFGSLFLRRK